MPFPKTSPAAQFDFGENWRGFSSAALTAARVDEARAALRSLLGPIDLKGHSFLDIGFGQGLSLLVAAECGATTVGCDINPKCAEVLIANRRYFPLVTSNPVLIVGSILDESIVDMLWSACPDRMASHGYDIVHSWGALHHTIDMYRAVRTAAGLVKPDGHMVVAIYNRHWTSPLWRIIKRLYVASPPWIRRSMVALLYPAIFVAKGLVTGRNPKQQQRGMDFYFDVVDWVGGYPYEYASIREVQECIEGLGFALVKCVPATVPTGCNQFVFQRNSTPSRP